MNNTLLIKIQADLADLRVSMIEAGKLVEGYSNTVVKAANTATNAVAKAEAADRAAADAKAKAVQSMTASEAAKVKAIEASTQASLAQARVEQESSAEAIKAAKVAAKEAESASRASIRADQEAVRSISASINADEKAANAAVAASQSIIRAKLAESNAIDVANRKATAAADRAAKDVVAAANRKARAEKAAANSEKRDLASTEVARRRDAATAKRAADDIAKAARRKAQAELEAAQVTQKQFGASTVVFQEFNRVIQDAPFGIMGVGNNLQQLATNFGALSIKANGTKAAIGEALKTFTTGINPAILAVSLLTTAFTYYQMGAFDSEEATESLTDALDKYRNALDSVNRAQIEGAANGEREVQAFKLLRMQATSWRVSMEQRLEAVKQMKKEYPDYLKGLTDEEILTGRVGDAYKNLTKWLIATAKARAFSDAMGENALKLATLEDKRIKNQIEFAELSKKASEASKNEINSAARVAGQFTASNSEALILQQKLAASFREGMEISEQINTIKQEDRRLQDGINESVKQGATFTKDLADETDKVKPISISDIFKEEDWITQGELIQKAISQGVITAEQGQSIKDFLANALTQSSNETLTAALMASIKDSYEQALAGLEEDPAFKPLDLKISYDPASIDQLTEEQKLIEQQMLDFEKRVIKLNEDTTKLLQQGISNLVSDTMFAFGEALASGDNAVTAAGKALVGSFAAFMGQFGKLLIEYGAAGLAYSAITKALLNPITAAPAALAAIAAGAALVLMSGAISGALKGSKSQTAGISQTPITYTNAPGREHGGSVNAGQAYIVGEKRPELFIPRSSGFIVPRIPDLGSNTSRSGMGGSSRITVEVVGRIENDHIRIANKRAINKISQT